MKKKNQILCLRRTGQSFSILAYHEKDLVLYPGWLFREHFFPRLLNEVYIKVCSPWGKSSGFFSGDFMLLLRSFTRAVSGVVWIGSAVTVLSVIAIKDKWFNMITQAYEEFLNKQFLFFEESFFNI